MSMKHACLRSPLRSRCSAWSASSVPLWAVYQIWDVSGRLARPSVCSEGSIKSWWAARKPCQLVSVVFPLLVSYLLSSIFMCPRGQDARSGNIRLSASAPSQTHTRSFVHRSLNTDLISPARRTASGLLPAINVTTLCNALCLSNFHNVAFLTGLEADLKEGGDVRRHKWLNQITSST